MSKLAKEIWNKHIEIFQHFDLVCHNGHSLEDETKSNALFNALTTLRYLYQSSIKFNGEDVMSAINYLEASKYYSDGNQDADY